MFGLPATKPETSSWFSGQQSVIIFESDPIPCLLIDSFNTFIAIELEYSTHAFQFKITLEIFLLMSHSQLDSALTHRYSVGFVF